MRIKAKFKVSTSQNKNTTSKQMNSCQSKIQLELSHDLAIILLTYNEHKLVFLR